MTTMTIDQLRLDRPLVFFDLEATGLSVVADRIVQFAGIRFEPDGRREEYVTDVNPTVPIPAEVVAIHGIDDARVADAPTFAQLTERLADFFAGADLAGYNLGKFDIPLLMEEFARAGGEFDLAGRRVVDAQEIFYKMEPRTLAGALQFYCGQELVDAHDALADVRATVSVLTGQLERYGGADSPVQPDVAALHRFTQRPGQLDATNRLRADEAGEVVFNFGKYRGRRVREVFRKEPSYFHWIQNRDFSIQVKRITREVFEALDPS